MAAGSSVTKRVDQPLALEIGKCTLDGVRVCTGLGRQLPNGGQLSARRVLAGGDAQAQPLGELRIDRAIRVKVPGHSNASFLNYCTKTLIQ